MTVNEILCRGSPPSNRLQRPKTLLLARRGRRCSRHLPSARAGQRWPSCVCCEIDQGRAPARADSPRRRDPSQSVKVATTGDAGPGLHLSRRHGRWQHNALGRDLLATPLSALHKHLVSTAISPLGGAWLSHAAQNSYPPHLSIMASGEIVTLFVPDSRLDRHRRDAQHLALLKRT